MKRKATFIFPFILFLIIIVILYRGLHVNPHAIQSPLIDKNAPAFSAPSVFNSKKIIDEKIFRHHISLLNIFASWCIACRAEQSALMQFHDREPDVQIIGLAFKDKPDAVKQFLKNNNPYTAVIDDRNGTIGINYGVYGTPETFIIDQSGIIRGKIVGPISPEILKNELVPLINKLLKIK